MIKMQLLAYGEWGCLLEAIQITDKKGLIGQDVYVIFCSELELKEVEIAVSKHLGILPKIQGGGDSTKIKVKAASLGIIIAL